jgi:hypothetical protein
LVVALMALSTASATRELTVVQHPRPASGQADAAGIDHLIAQLGDNRFHDREAATAALTDIGGPALPGLRKAAAESSDPEIRRRAKQLVGMLENRLDGLLADYRGFGYPMPPADAPLVWFEPESAPAGHPTLFELSFLLEPGTEDRPAVVMQGTRERWLSWRPRSEVLSLTRLTRLQIKRLVDSVIIDEETGLVLAIHCQARGWEALAQALVDKRSQWSDRPAILLRSGTWERWSGALSLAGADWPLIAKQLRALIAADKALDTEANRALLAALEVSLVPSKARPGSAEALIDGLMRVRGDGNVDKASDPHYRRLLEQGFDAVPALIEHLIDQRLTRAVDRGTGPEPPYRPAYRYRVCHLASDLLRGIADGGLKEAPAAESPEEEPFEPHPKVLKKADARAWWNKAQALGEERYLLSRVLPEGGAPQGENTHLLRLLGHKYPQHLVRAYRTILVKYPEADSQPFAEAICASRLGKETKKELLLDGLRNEDPEHREAATALRRQDPGCFAELLVTLLDGLPRTPTGTYRDSPTEWYASLVSQQEDPRAWRALERAARRADAGLRMHYLLVLGNLPFPFRAPLDERQCRRRLAFLAAFLDDATVRDLGSDPKKFAGEFVAARFPRLEARNLAAWQMARILRMEVDPVPEWTAGQWAQLRAEVRQAAGR